MNAKQAAGLLAFSQLTLAMAKALARLAADGKDEESDTIAGLLDGMIFARRSRAGKTSGGHAYERGYKIGLSVLQGEALARLLGVAEKVVVQYGTE